MKYKFETIVKLLNQLKIHSGCDSRLKVSILRRSPHFHLQFFILDLLARVISESSLTRLNASVLMKSTVV